MQHPPHHISRRTLCRWLYRLNWHLREMRQELRHDYLQRKPLNQELALRLVTLNKLKADVICKLIAEGNAKIQAKHIISKKNFYCVKVVKGHSFHTPNLEQVREAVSIYEWRKSNLRTQSAQAGPQ